MRIARFHQFPRHAPTWELVHEYLLDQIATGRFPKGSWLPSVRMLATELKINRNTVSKVYQTLGREGVLETIRGRGVRVLRAEARSAEPQIRFQSEFQSLIREAYRHGIPRDWLLTTFASTARETYAELALRIGFVECSQHETNLLARDLSAHLAMHIDPVVLSDLEDDPAGVGRRFDVLATTFFHLQEVNAAAQGLSLEVVGMNHSPSHETVLQIARLRRGITIAVICQNERTLELVKSVVELYAHGRIVGAISTDMSQLKAALQDADVIVDHAAAHDQVTRLKPDAATITVKFQLERQSIEYLHETVTRRRELPGAAILRS